MTLPNQGPEQGVEETPPTGDGAAAEVTPTEGTEAQVQPEGESQTPGAGPTPQRPAPDSDKELSWLRVQYQQVMTDLNKTRKELQQYEYAGLDDGERGARELQDRQTELQQQEQHLQEAAYAQGLWEFYTSYVPHTVITGATPVEWQQNVLDHLVGENQRLMKENVALQKATVPGAGAPRVPSQSGGKPQKQSVYGMSWEEIEAVRQAAEMGLVAPEDLPG